VIGKLTNWLLEKLRRKPFRDAYVAEHVRTGIAQQVRVLREQRGWNQGIFAEKVGKPQSVASRLEDPDYGKFSLKTLLEIASGLDVALHVRFVSFHDFLRLNENVSPDAFKVESFDATKLNEAREATIPREQEVEVSPSFYEVCTDDPTQHVIYTHTCAQEDFFGAGGLAGMQVIGLGNQGIGTMRWAGNLHLLGGGVSGLQTKRHHIVPRSLQPEQQRLSSALQEAKVEIANLRATCTRLASERDAALARLSATPDEDGQNDVGTLPAFMVPKQRGEGFIQ
jgi:transcriptional regulator with XRE-family HTH domain